MMVVIEGEANHDHGHEQVPTAPPRRAESPGFSPSPELPGSKHRPDFSPCTSSVQTIVDRRNENFETPTSDKQSGPARTRSRHISLRTRPSRNSGATLLTTTLMTGSRRSISRRSIRTTRGPILLSNRRLFTISYKKPTSTAEEASGEHQL